MSEARSPFLKCRSPAGCSLLPARAIFARLESGGFPNALSMSESAGIDSFFGARDAEALFRGLACPSDQPPSVVVFWGQRFE
jgi:hypothetical protein